MNCKTLDEAKEKYPEFEDVIDTDNINAKTIVLAGGAAANSELRRKFFALRDKGYTIYAPEMKYCTDNAAMIAASAYFLAGTIANLESEVFSRNQ